MLGDHTANHVLIQQCLLPIDILLAPYAPELFGGSAGGVANLGLVSSHEHLRKLEKLGDIGSILIAVHLPDGLLHLHRGCFALNDGEGDTVDEQDDIGAGVFLLIPAIAGELLGHVVDVVLGMLPVDIAQIEALGGAVHQLLGVAFTQHEGIVDLFAGADQAFRQGLVQIGHGGLDVFGLEFVGNAAVGELIEGIEPFAEDIAEEDTHEAAALLQAFRGGDVGIAQLGEELYGGGLAYVFFEIQIWLVIVTHVNLLSISRHSETP